LRLIDALERQFTGNEGAGFVVRDHYVARLLTLLELLSSAYRLAKQQKQVLSRLGPSQITPKAESDNYLG
jgi:hypothetical protein